MSNLRQAAQQALGTLERCALRLHDPSFVALPIDALRAALAAAVAEPVASVTECEACFTPDVCQLRGTCDHYAAERLRVAAPPQREPDVWECRAGGLKPLSQRLYEMQPENIQRHYTRICPPQREREPLTDEQIDAVTREQWGEQLGCMKAAHRAFVRAIERAHGIKEQP